MKVNTCDLIGVALDWAVAKCEGYKIQYSANGTCIFVNAGDGYECFSPSTDWSQGGPIIEMERITINYDNLDGTGACKAYYLKTLFDDQEGWQQYGTTPLIAAMRCYVASKLCDTVENPL